MNPTFEGSLAYIGLIEGSAYNATDRVVLYLKTEFRSDRSVHHFLDSEKIYEVSYRNTVKLKAVVFRGMSEFVEGKRIWCHSKLLRGALGASGAIIVNDYDRAEISIFPKELEWNYENCKRLNCGETIKEKNFLDFHDDRLLFLRI